MERDVTDVSRAAVAEGNSEVQGVIGLRGSGARRARFSAPGSAVHTIPGGPTAPAAARRIASEAAADHIGDAGLDTLRLLVSEVVTNAVTHAGAGPDARIDIAVSRTTGGVRVEVSTAARTFEHVPAKPSAFASGGRGLFLVDMFSERWGIERDGPNTVWFELVQPAPDEGVQAAG
jgi:anti-sigma regulatory factor (Ser/Thr protein kinase)